MNDRPTPETDAVKFQIGDSNHFAVHVVHARRLERERDEAREEIEKLRESLDWISKQYDDSKPTHQVAMTAYEMSCTARYALQKDTTK